MKPLAYIHIGLEKTGTTTLQEFFHINRELLKYDNIYYPSSPGARNHTDLAAFAYDKALGDLIVQKNIQTPELKEAYRTRFKLEFEQEIANVKKKGYHLLVSSEHLSSRAFSKAEKRKLIALFTDLGYTPKVIVYIRRQDQYLLSTYSTWLKCGATAELNKNAYKRKRYDYLTMLEMWSEVVGKENMIVKIFERPRMFKQDLIQDFLHIIGIQKSDKYQLPPSDLNKSLDKSKLLFLKSMNMLVPEHIEKKKNPLRGNLVEVLENLENGAKLKLPEELSQEILAYYKADNEQIKEAYFPEMDGSLFNEEVKKIDSSDTETNALSSEEIYKLMSSLWNYQQKEINDLREQLAQYKHEEENQ